MCSRKMDEITGRILVIDDEAIVRDSIVAYLEDSGFDVVEAKHGQQGLELFEEHKPDLVLTDLRMPGMDGLHLLDEVHKLNPDAPVIVISGAGVMGDVVEALRLGAVDYLIKPLADMEMLVHTISKSLERRELLEQNRRYREDLEGANQELKEALQILEKDQEAGRMVQQQLLPPSPFVTKSGYRTEHKIIPSLYLSGDFIDFRYYDDRYFAFYLTDVSGHGASSAFATIWLKHVSMALVEQGTGVQDNWAENEKSNPFLYALNEELLASKLGHHMTCFTGLIDTQAHKLRYSVAGHLPMPLMRSKGGEAHYLEGKGRPLGLFPKQEWGVLEVDFPEGASLIGFSDGVLEVLPPKDLLEKEAYLLDLMSGDLRNFTHVLDILQLDTLQSAPDDIAVLTIRRDTLDV